MYKPGDFSFMSCNMTANSCTNAYNVIDDDNLWDFFLEQVPEDTGYMFWDHPTLEIIGDQLVDDGHSGASFAYVMRVMQSIKLNGWDVYLKSHGIS